MQIYQENFTIQTPGREIINITEQLNDHTQRASIKQGLCNVFLTHTSASLIFCENYDPDVRRDLETFIARFVSDSDRSFLHDTEGPDDMPSHIRTVLTQNSLMIPIAEKQLLLGRWQGVFLWEHRLAPHRRQLTVTIFGNL